MTAHGVTEFATVKTEKRESMVCGYFLRVAARNPALGVRFPALTPAARQLVRPFHT